MKTFFVDTKSDLVFEYEDESDTVTFPNGQTVNLEYRLSKVKHESSLKMFDRTTNMIEKEFIELD